MRHGKKFNHLSRKVGHRRALLRSLASSLILNKRIVTTVAKAKELRKYVEPLITKAKNPTVSSRRVVFSYLQKKEAVHELFTEVSGKVAERNGGYTRIVKMGTRLGDNAEMAMIELVDYNTLYSQSKDSSAKKKTRRRRGGKGASSEATASTSAEVQDVAVEEAPAAEVETIVDEEPTQVDDSPSVEETTDAVEVEPVVEEAAEEVVEAEAEVETETVVESEEESTADVVSDDAEPEVETPSAQAETEAEGSSDEDNSEEENTEEKKD